MNIQMHVKTFFERRRIVSFIVLALVISFVMVVISLWIYVVSGAIKLDLSRPGYERVREHVVQEGDNEKPFSSSGKLTPEAIKDFQERLGRQQSELNKLGNFGGETLDDNNLGLE